MNIRNVIEGTMVAVGLASFGLWAYATALEIQTRNNNHYISKLLPGFWGYSLNLSDSAELSYTYATDYSLKPSFPFLEKIIRDSLSYYSPNVVKHYSGVNGIIDSVRANILGVKAPDGSLHSKKMEYNSKSDSETIKVAQKEFDHYMVLLIENKDKEAAREASQQKFVQELENNAFMKEKYGNALFKDN